MKSMTGFGRGEYRSKNYQCSIEIKTINHRYRDYFIRMPKQLNVIEDRIREIINSFIKRGRIEIYINFESLKDEERRVRIDIGLAKGYYNALNVLKQSLPEMKNDINLSFIARFPEVLIVDDKEFDVNELWDALNKALREALENLVDSRSIEGNNLKIDLLLYCNKIKERVQIIENLSPEVEKEYKEKLLEKITDYTNSIDIDEGRILTEVAILADKTNITEEITRLISHINQFINTLEEETIGRKLDFIIQEMNREINTIGSKTSYYPISKEVVSIKSDIEKIREQIQNIE